MYKRLLVLLVGAALALVEASVWAQACKYTSIPATAPASRFADKRDGTVTDETTGLTWKRCSEGQTWDGTICTGIATGHDWQQALQLADSASYAGKDDWRLPNVKELASIVERACYLPAVNLEVFPGTPYSFFWSSSPVDVVGALAGDRAWTVNFYRGGVSLVYTKNNVYFVRLVRGGETLADSAESPGDRPLNDTGLDWWADCCNNNITSEPPEYPGEDASYGRDFTQNDDDDGHAGFVFTKLDVYGNPLPATAMSWSCVRDEVTGLIWENKTDDGGSRDKGWRYTWYDPDYSTNGGADGVRDGTTACYDPARCDTYTFVADVNSVGLCGASDWRLPTREELHSITDLSRHAPAIDAAYFPHFPDFDSSLWYYWSSSPDPYDDNHASIVHFSSGVYGVTSKSEGHFVRLVRAGDVSLLSARGTAQANHTWMLVSAVSDHLNPVLIAGPPTYHGADPGVVRLQNITDTGFELRFQEWDYRARLFGDNYHGVEDIPYVVLQRGRHTMSDGSVWDVGTCDLGGTGAWQGVSFREPFSNPPKLFLTVQTNNGGQAVAVRARNLTPDGFEAALFEEEALMDGHLVESIGYLAIDSPTGGGLIDLDGAQVPYLLQSLSADSRWVPALSQRLKVEEDQSRDEEVNHIDETLHVLALGEQILAQQVTNNGGDPAALRRLEPTQDPAAPLEWGLIRGIDHSWQVLPFAKRYSDPVLVAKPVSSNGADPGVIRIKDLTGSHAELRYQEWSYLDDKHWAPEDLFYLVSEAGSHQLGGLDVEADHRVSSKLGRAGQWETIPFNTVFPDTPAVFASVMTYQGADTVTTRLRDLDPSKFALAMDEQESKSDGHVNETLGWIAIKPGRATTSDGRKLQVFFHQLSDQLTAITYPSATSARFPVVVSDVDSTFGGDPVFLRYVNPTDLQIELKLGEEQSADDETGHVLEEVGVFVGE